MSVEQALAAGMPAWGVEQEWHDEVGQAARPEYAAAHGIATTSLQAWLSTHDLTTTP